ncbi:MAG: hypothetical protein JWQ40_869 [Segetibacter sp.]|nr:hypothetical protein [Segetibacter sp.]
MKVTFFTLCFFYFLAPGSAQPTLVAGNGQEQERAGSSKRSSKQIVWDTTSLKRIAPPDSSAFYPRMIQLKNGLLLAVYATNGNIVAVKSTDDGHNWTPPMLVAAQRSGVNMDTPDLLQLKDGTVIVCYATRPQAALRGKPDTAQKFEVRVQSSTNNGLSFGDEKILYKAGSSFRDGCWEPSLLQLPSGEIQLFFANEAIYTSSSEQNISMLQSVDNRRTWSSNPQIVSFRKGSRDGMPVPLWLKKERKIVVAIEDPGHENFKPFTIRSSPKGKWKSAVDGEDENRTYALANHITDSIYAGAPYLRQLSTGETILSYQSTEGRTRNRDNNAVMRVAIGDKHAAKFGHVSTPFNIPETYHALWNSICVLKDDTIVALTSTNGYSGAKSEIWMIMGRLK